VTTFLSNLENELPSDCEQCPPAVVGAGLEMADFLISRAPSPVLILGQEYDFFDRRGHQEACDDVRRFYEQLGAPPENVRCFRGDRTHGYFPENQEAMVEFFARHARIGRANRVEETEALEPASLHATPTGSVMEAGAKPIYAFTRERAHGLARNTPALSSGALVARLTELLSLPEERAVPHYRILRPVKIGDATYARYAIETEANVRAILRKRMADPAYAHTLEVASAVHLYLPHYASEEDLASDPLALALQEEHELYALDVRGLGESVPDEARPFWHPYGIDYVFHVLGAMFGESYLGRRVYDVLRSIDLLADCGAESIRVYGRGQGSLIALFVALLDPRVASVTLKNAPCTYREWVDVPLVDWPVANVLPGVLKYFDLDDCLRALEDKVTVIEPWDARMSPKQPST